MSASALDKNLPLEKANLFAFLLAYSVFSLYLADAEYRLHLGNDNKKLRPLLCIALGLHYIWLTPNIGCASGIPNKKLRLLFGIPLGFG